MIKLIFVLALLLPAISLAQTDYHRVVGINDGTVIEAPSTFSFVVASESTDGTTLVLSNDLFQQGQTVSTDIVDLWTQYGFTDDDGDTISVSNGLGVYDRADGLRAWYNVTVLPYNLLIQEAPAATIKASVAPVKGSVTAARKLAAQMRKVTKR